MSGDSNAYATGLDADRIAAEVARHEEQLQAALQQVDACTANLAAIEVRCCEAGDSHVLLFEAERAQATQELESARCAVEMARNAIDAAKAPLHPIRKTPPEVLGLIFERCIDSFTMAFVQDVNVYYERQVQPFRLAQVCRSWRLASLSSPHAWWTVELDFDKVTSGNADAWHNYLLTCTERSGAIALTVRLRRKLAVDFSWHVALVTRLARDVLPRCGDLSLTFNITVPRDCAIQLYTSKTPMLQKLTLGVPGITFENSIHFFPETPVLEVLYLGASVMGHWSFPTASTVILDQASLLQVHKPLMGLPCVRRLNFFCTQVPQGILPNTPVTCALVTFLRVVLEHESSIRDLADGIKYPSLIELHLRGAAQGAPGRVEYFALLATSGYVPRLQFIYIGRLQTDDLCSFLDALAHCRSLQRITIARSCFSSRGLQHIYSTFKPRDDGWICPELHTLNLADECLFDEMSDHVPLANLAETRIAAAGVDRGDSLSFLTSFLVPASVDPVVYSRIQAALATRAPYKV